MVLEFLHCGYPVLHNCDAWKDFGYYYAENDTIGGMQQLCEALNFHDERLETYKGHAKTLFWRHSIYNPNVQKAWLELMNGDTIKN